MNQGRREFDRTVDPVMQNYVEERLRETRHELRQAIAEVATAHATAALKSTEEHAAVRADLAGVRRDIAELLPLRDAVESLRRHDALSDEREQTTKSLLAEVSKQRVQTRNFMVAVAGLILAAYPIVALLLDAKS